jgi:hypothetical protein
MKRKYSEYGINLIVKRYGTRTHQVRRLLLLEL